MQILMNVLEKVQVMSVSRDVSTIQEDSIALAVMVINLLIIHNVKVLQFLERDSVITLKLGIKSCISVAFSVIGLAKRATLY